jgi:hypothetical protein
MPDFHSGATDQLGRFIEGFLLRRLHRGSTKADNLGPVCREGPEFVAK